VNKCILTLTRALSILFYSNGWVSRSSKSGGINNLRTYEKENTMDKSQLILACLAAGEGKAFEPVQIQKLVFLFQEKASAAIGSKPFHFKPYDYGPFSKEVYDVLDGLASEGKVEVQHFPSQSVRKYAATVQGQQEGKSIINSMNGQYKEFLGRLTNWVLSIGFAELVGAVYKEYPDMRANSVFWG
jgi:uncharacterized protein